MLTRDINATVRFGADRRKGIEQKFRIFCLNGASPNQTTTLSSRSITVSFMQHNIIIIR